MMPTRLISLLTLVSACAIGGDEEDSTFISALSGTANVSLTSSSARVSLTADNEWLLSKTGSLSGNTVTWNITATKTATVSGQLLLQGTMSVTNTGNGPATIGNIVINLQARQGNTWVTKSSDIADATQGDAATTANIHAAASSENKASFSENGASGALEFMDASNNTLFSLVPQQMIGAGETKTLLFSASFDNNHAALQLMAGTPIRAEVIVTFGNATKNGNSTPNVDINSNGTIDADEARVRSVPSRLTVTVPAQVNGSAMPTLSDTLSDIAATGDVTFSNVQFNLGATSGTVRATVSGGTNGGSITNCAHLTSADQLVNAGGSTFTTIEGINLQACSTVDVGGTPPTCTVPGSPGCGWNPGDLVTNTQGDWDGPSSSLITNLFNTVYFSSGAALEVGIIGSTGHSIRFTSGAAVLAYLTASGTPAALTNDVTNPTVTSSGRLGGEVTALALNVDYSAAGRLGGSVTASFGDLSVCGVTGFPDTTVAGVLNISEQALGGASTGYDFVALTLVAAELNAAFESGTPSTFAQAHVVNGACP